MLIGRDIEKKALLDMKVSEQSEFVAIYGRLRVGKTYLVRETFNYNFAFQHTGILDAPLKEQLKEFRQSLYNMGMKKRALPTSWSDAFHLLEEFLTSLPEGKKIVFIDELPWMDTPRSNFIRALDHFWNGWATSRRDILLIVCGSATSWIIDNIIMNYGGLHNRLTKKIHLHPFSLRECELYSNSRNLGFSRRHIIEAYMAIGGIPYYWSFMKKGLSLAQNFDHIFFDEDGELATEYDALYASLFKNPNIHIAVIEALATKKRGLSRTDILKIAKLTDSGAFSKALKELEQCGFIRKYTCFDKEAKDSIYQLMDNYTLFYFQFIKKNVNGDRHFWTSMYNSTTHNTWAGLAFERVCLQHISQIKKALGFEAVISTAHAWTYKDAQIDLLIDRNDHTINICEMKFYKTRYNITQEDIDDMQRRLDTFRTVTETNKSLILTLITSYGVAPTSNTNQIQKLLTMEELFL